MHRYDNDRYAAAVITRSALACRRRAGGVDPRAELTAAVCLTISASAAAAVKCTCRTLVTQVEGQVSSHLSAINIPYHILLQQQHPLKAYLGDLLMLTYTCLQISISGVIKTYCSKLIDNCGSKFKFKTIYKRGMGEILISISLSNIS